ncbi:MAG TPA: methyltransferase, partial [Chitinophagaceae bacterium]|nr:methyltransferase [Chitinophagaceae bacterium]
RKAGVWACDISEVALAVASKNAKSLGADIHFEKLDILNKEEHPRLPLFDIIVSNPPYVPLRDKSQMQANVVKYEPAEALFVPDDDPLLFYKVIAGLSKAKLNPGGMVFVETHEDNSEQVAALFRSAGFKVEIRKDMQGKNRMLKATSHSPQP